MAFDSATYAPVAPKPIAALIDAAVEPCPVWAAQNPDRALAFLFVAPQDCAAVDAVTAL